jgi:hypothetical protein
MDFTIEQENIILKMYNDGETLTNIRNILKCRTYRISDFLKSKNLGKRSKTLLKDKDCCKHSNKELDREFFSKIDTEEKAYWLGFLYADGCVYMFFAIEKCNKMQCKSVTPFMVS